jgi:hypothetical protein
MIPDEAVEAAPTEVPLQYCDGGVCERLVDRWEWSKRHSAWIAVCNGHGDRIVEIEATK